MICPNCGTEHDTSGCPLDKTWAPGVDCYPNPPHPWCYPSSSIQWEGVVLDRIATALERIADVLERKEKRKR